MKKQIILWSAGIVLFGVLVFILGRLSVDVSALQGLPVYSLSPGVTGMIGGGPGYTYEFSTSGFVPAEDMVATVQRYLDRQGNPDLALARLREFTWAYQAEVVERSQCITPSLRSPHGLIAHVL